MGSWGFRNANLTENFNPDTDAQENDYGKSGVEIRPNERFYTGERVMGLNVVPDEREVALPQQDFVRPTRAEETIDLNRVGIEAPVSAQPKLTVYDPNDVARTTIRETTEDNGYLGIEAPADCAQKLTVYDPDDIMKVTGRNTLADWDWYRNFGRQDTPGNAEIRLQDAVRNTFRIVLIVVPLQLSLALVMALMLGHLRRGRDIVLWIWSIPLGISDLAAGLVWLALLNDRGFLNSGLFRLGLIAAPQSYLTYETPGALLGAIVLAELWRATAIVLVIIVAGLQLIPKEYGEAASVFGASPWSIFRRITLPLLKPSIQTALILRTVLAFEMFGIVLALGGRNIPVLVSEAYNWQYANQDYGVAAAYAVVVMALSLAATLVYLRVLRPARGQMP
jgi:multiple sugar transport system permease protein